MTKRSAAARELGDFDQRMKLDKNSPHLVKLSPADQSLIGEAVTEQWGDRARALLRNGESLEALLVQTTNLFNDASDMIERRLYGLNSDDTVTDALRTSDYYRQPIWSALKSDSAASDSPVQSARMQALIEYATGISAPGDEFIVPATREDLERLGTEIDFRARLFWAEVHAIHERQRGWTIEERYRALMAAEPEHEQRRLSAILSTRGHLVHGVQAKDMVGRWAYYHVYVPPRQEFDFLEAIEGHGTIDLEDFGRVILSAYEDNFREHQRIISHARFNNIIQKYRGLAVRERQYSYSSGENVGPFQVQRFFRALQDEGSRDALLRDLVHRTELLGPLRLADTDQAAAPSLLFEYGLGEESARIFVALIRERHLGIAEVAFLARLLTNPDEATIDEFLHSLRAVALHVGPTSEQFERFLLLICQNRSLTHPSLLSAALLLASGQKKPRWWSSDLLPGLLPLLGLPVVGTLGVLGTGAITALTIAQKFTSNRAQTVDMDWSSVQRALAGCDMLLRFGGELTSRFAEELQCFVIDAKRGAAEVRATVQAISRKVAVKKDKILIGRDAIERAGLNIESNVSGRLVELSLDKRNNELINSALKEIIESDIINNIRSLTVFWHAIESRADSEQDEFLRELLRNSLSDVFDRLETPLDKQEAAIAVMAMALLANEAERAQPEALPLQQDKRPAPPLPTEAPEPYKGLRGPETPPEFVKRVYGEFLGRDPSLGPSLTRAHIRKLDPTLYAAIDNWSRKNEWPRDVDLPTLKEQNTRWVKRVTQDGANDLSLREAQRLAGVLQRRKGRAGN